MRHRSRRPLLDLLRWRPHLPGIVPRIRVAAATSLTRGRVAVLAGVALAGLLAVLVLATEVGGGHDGDVAGEPVAGRTGLSVSRGGPRTPLPSSSDPSTRAPESRAPEARATDSHPADSPAADSRATDAGAVDGRATAPAPATADPPPAPTEPAGSSVLTETPSPSRSGPADPTSGAASPGTDAPSSTAPADTTAPQTTATTATPGGPVWAVAIGADEPATFACSLDGAPFSPCGSTTQYSDLDAGWHTLSVQATDTAGNVDSSPAVLEWHPTGAGSDD